MSANPRIIHNPYGYTGREMDTLRLYYYRARYYSPILHRFLTPDPIEHASGDWNWYRYVGNDPVNRVDPSGLEWYNPATWFSHETNQVVTGAAQNILVNSRLGSVGGPAMDAMTVGLTPDNIRNMHALKDKLTHNDPETRAIQDLLCKKKKTVSIKSAKKVPSPAETRKQKSLTKKYCRCMAHYSKDHIFKNQSLKERAKMCIGLTTNWDSKINIKNTGCD